MARPGKKAFPLRIDTQLYARIERQAAAELRSVNAQIEYLLREAIERREHGQRAIGTRDESATNSPPKVG